MNVKFCQSISEAQLSYVQALPALATGAKIRKMITNPDRIYAYDGEMIMAYPEYTRCGNRIEITWLANWGTACGCDELDEMLMHYACSS